jgi:hypothetical protein
MFDYLRQRRRRRRKPVDPATKIGREVGKVASGVILTMLRSLFKK